MSKVKFKIMEASTYKEAVKNCPIGYKIPYLWELIKLIQENKAKELFEFEKGYWIFYWTKQTKDDKNTNKVRGLIRSYGGDWGASWYLPFDSIAYGRVAYIK